MGERPERVYNVGALGVDNARGMKALPLNELSASLKFDLSGRFLVKWGSEGTKDGQMMAPAAVAVDEKGNVFVVETGNNRVQEFTVPLQ